jgi:DNA-binding CsgD family transcriptional regulator
VRRPAVRFTQDADGIPESDSESLAKRRTAIANFCKTVEAQISGTTRAIAPAIAVVPSFPQVTLAGLTPRVQQTLHRMLAGDSEKEIGIHMGVSRHTVHVYVKTLYRHFDVNSRGELLAKFVDGAFRVAAKTA